MSTAQTHSSSLTIHGYEPRGLFLIEHLQLPLLDKTAPRPVVTVVKSMISRPL